MAAELVTLRAPKEARNRGVQSVAATCARVSRGEVGAEPVKAAPWQVHDALTGRTGRLQDAEVSGSRSARRLPGSPPKNPRAP